MCIRDSLKGATGATGSQGPKGDKGKDLILQTSGRVYVQVKDRFYEINFRGDRCV